MQPIPYVVDDISTVQKWIRQRQGILLTPSFHVPIWQSYPDSIGKHLSTLFSRDNSLEINRRSSPMTICIYDYTYIIYFQLYQHRQKQKQGLLVCSNIHFTEDLISIERLIWDWWIEIWEKKYTSITIICIFIRKRTWICAVPSRISPCVNDDTYIVHVSHLATFPCTDCHPRGGCEMGYRVRM